MPLYEFACIECKRIQEKIQKFEDLEPNCDLCKERMIRIMSASTFILKGGGWYKDGYTKSPETKNK
jgi:putative FmdB family regulatory protein